MTILRKFALAVIVAFIVSVTVGCAQKIATDLGVQLAHQKPAMPIESSYWCDCSNSKGQLAPIDLTITSTTDVLDDNVVVYKYEFVNKSGTELTLLPVYNKSGHTSFLGEMMKDDDDARAVLIVLKPKERKTYELKYVGAPTVQIRAQLAILDKHGSTYSGGLLPLWFPNLWR